MSIQMARRATGISHRGSVSGGSVGTPVAGALVENTSSSATTAVPYPSGISAGDQLVAFVSHATTVLATNPSGWTQVYSSNRGGSLPSLWVGMLTAAGSESGSLTVSHGTSVAIGGMIRVPGVDQTTPLDVAASTQQNSSAASTLVLPSITTTTGNTLLVAVGCINSLTANASACVGSGTFAEDFDRSAGTRAATMWHSVWSGSGASSASTITWTGSATGHGCMLALRPA